MLETPGVSLLVTWNPTAISKVVPTVHTVIPQALLTLQKSLQAHPVDQLEPPLRSPLDSMSPTKPTPVKSSSESTAQPACQLKALRLTRDTPQVTTLLDSSLTPPRPTRMIHSYPDNTTSPLLFAKVHVDLTTSGLTCW